MTQQIINIGNAPGDGSGDPLRTAFNKINQNFTELYAGLFVLVGTDFGLLGPIIVDYGLVSSPVTHITDYGSI